MNCIVILLSFVLYGCGASSRFQNNAEKYITVEQSKLSRETSQLTIYYLLSHMINEEKYKDAKEYIDIQLASSIIMIDWILLPNSNNEKENITAMGILKRVANSRDKYPITYDNKDLEEDINNRLTKYE